MDDLNEIVAAMGQVNETRSKVEVGHVHAGGKTMYWAGIIALLVGIIVGGLAAKAAWDARRQASIKRAILEVSSSRSRSNRGRFWAEYAQDAVQTTPFGRSARENSRRLTTELEQIDDIITVRKYVAARGLHLFSWPVAALGLLSVLAGLWIAVRTRKKQVGLGLAAILFLLGAVGAGSAFTGHADARLMNEYFALHGLPK